MTQFRITDIRHTWPYLKVTDPYLQWRTYIIHDPERGGAGRRESQIEPLSHDVTTLCADVARDDSSFRSVLEDLRMRQDRLSDRRRTTGRRQVGPVMFHMPSRRGGWRRTGSRERGGRGGALLMRRFLFLARRRLMFARGLVFARLHSFNLGYRMVIYHHWLDFLDHNCRLCVGHFNRFFTCCLLSFAMRKTLNERRQENPSIDRTNPNVYRTKSGLNNTANPCTVSVRETGSPRCGREGKRDGEEATNSWEQATATTRQTNAWNDWRYDRFPDGRTEGRTSESWLAIGLFLGAYASGGSFVELHVVAQRRFLCSAVACVFLCFTALVLTGCQCISLSLSLVCFSVSPLGLAVSLSLTLSHCLSLCLSLSFSS